MDTPAAHPLYAPFSPSVARDGLDAPSRSTERELARLRAQVRKLSAELVRAQEDARRHVARELHDGVGSELTATRFALAGVETWLPADAPSQCAAALAVANRSLDAVYAACREAITQLQAPFPQIDLADALSHWTADFAARTQLRTDFVCAADARLARLPADAALAVFRVAQEALNNVARHASAQSADVRIETSRRHLALLVSDDGIGFTANARTPRHGHFGLSGMQARCAAFDGALRIRARRAGAPGSADAPRGTLLQARFAWDAMLAQTPSAERRALQS
jgi:signal transduction histidine kinase